MKLAADGASHELPKVRPLVRGKKKPPAPVEVHDRQQLELRFSYGLSGEGTAIKTTVDTYLFVPKNVGVNRHNYTKDQFYGDVTALMRLDAEPLSLDLLADSHYPRSPLHGFGEGVQRLRESPRPPPTQPVVIHVKLYAHLFARGVRVELKKLQKRLGKLETESDGERFEERLSDSLDEIRFALKAYRRVRAAYWPYEQLAHESLADAMRNADEYMSLFLEERLALLLQAIERRGREGLAEGFLARCRLTLGALARQEVAYRRRYGYLSYSDADAPSGDYYTYRASMLKKAVQQALYLDPRAAKRDTFLRNAAAAAGAAVAAIWAVLAGLPQQMSKVSGSTQMLFFGGAVLAYVAKDRIKALTSEALSRRLRTFDHVSYLTSASIATTGLSIPRLQFKEGMRFLSLGEVPPDVLALRQNVRTLRSADLALEEIIHHRKVVKIGSKDEPGHMPDGYGVLDILRLNVRHFLVRLDEPLDQVAFYDWRREAFGATRLPKVYHLNLVVKVRRESLEGEVQESFERLRVVLNKDGIVRVEVVSLT